MLEALHGVSQGILLLRDGTVVFANRALGRLIGAEAGALSGVPLASLVRAEDGPVIQGLVSPAGDGDLPREVGLLRPDGSSVPVQALAARVMLDGQALDMVSVADACSSGVSCLQRAVA